MEVPDETPADPHRLDQPGRLVQPDLPGWTDQWEEPLERRGGSLVMLGVWIVLITLVLVFLA